MYILYVHIICIYKRKGKGKAERKKIERKKKGNPRQVNKTAKQKSVRL